MTPLDYATSPFCQQHSRVSAPRARHYPSGLRYVRQCLDCGNPAGSQVSAAAAMAATQGQPERFDEGRRRIAAFFREQAEERKASERAWWDWYNAYLNSPEWFARRDKVMRRANGICEGCGARPASHTHHLTYAHVGHELLFELVALCTGCHDHAHRDNANAPRAFGLVAS